MGLNSLTLDLPVMTSLDLSMLGLRNLTLNCTKLVYANLRGSYKLASAVSPYEQPPLRASCSVCDTRHVYYHHRPLFGRTTPWRSCPPSAPPGVALISP